MNQYQQEAHAVNYQWYNWQTRKDNRDTLVAKYAWAIPDGNAIELLAGMSPIIEMGAGNGYWAKLIAEAGGRIEPYDKCPGEHHHAAPPSYLWYPVRAGGPEAITEAHRDHVLLLVWPPYGGSLAHEALTRYLDVGGNTVVFVGESDGGCTADESFFELLEARFDAVGCAGIPQWWGLHDSLTVYRRKTANE